MVASSISRISGGGLDIASPINWLNPLNRGVVADFAAVPGLVGGSQFPNLVRPIVNVNANATLTDFASHTGVWKAIKGGFGLALDFDGTDDRAAIPEGGIVHGNGDFSFASHFQLDSIAGAPTLLTITGDGIDSYGVILGSSGSGDVSFVLQTVQTLASGLVVSAGKSYTLVISYQRASGAYFYLWNETDGTYSTAVGASGSTPSTTVNAATGNIAAWRSSVMAGSFVDGRIAHIRLYGRRLLSAFEAARWRQEFVSGFQTLYNWVPVHDTTNAGTTGNRRRRILLGT